MDKDREWTRTYMMEATQTRQFKQQHPEPRKHVVHGWCPVCAMAGKGKVPQTKEHLYGGQCTLTAPIVSKWNKSIQ